MEQHMIMQNKRLIAIVFAVAVLLSIPFLAMKFTVEVNWSPIDFIIAGVLLLATGLACEYILRKVRSFGYRLAVCTAILLALFIIWAELASV